MAEATMVDYYAVLNLPPRADLAGIENAYARISDDLALRSAEDDTCHAALSRVNEAYAVLSKPELRRIYDREFFSKEIAEAERLRRTELRRKSILSGILIGGLGLIVMVQAGVLLYIGWDQGIDLFHSLIP